MPARRRLAFAAAAVVLAVAVAAGALLAIDVDLHGRYERSAGFNVWGYRGGTVGRKKPGEYRIVVLGGSSAYGYGVSADEALPAVLERLLRMRSPRFTVVNLAYNNEGAYSFKPTLQDYRWLDYDLAFLYEGYNDLADDDRVNVAVFRHDSPIFRLTGYLPIFPIIFREKAATLHGGKTVFAGALRTTADVASALEAQLGRVSAEPSHVIAGGSDGCHAPWGPYCRSIAAAIDYARSEQARVIVGTQPYLRVSALVHDKHVAQQNELRAMLSRRFGGDADVRYVNLGDAVDLRDPSLSFDQMHLTASGNERIAMALVEPVLEMAAHDPRQKASS